MKRLLARGFDALERGYARLLASALRHVPLVLLAGCRLGRLGVYLLDTTPREFIPVDDRGAVHTFTRAPEGSTIDYTDRYQRMAEDIVLDTPEVEKTFSVVALGLGTPGEVTEGAMFTTLSRSRAASAASRCWSTSCAAGSPASRASSRSRSTSRPWPRARAIRSRSSSRGPPSGARALRRRDHRARPRGPRRRQPADQPAHQQAAARGGDRPQPGQRPRRAGARDRHHLPDTCSAASTCRASSSAARPTT